MDDGMRDSSVRYPTNTTKMANDIGPKKTMVVIFIVVGCFAVLWPKVFYPMLVGPPQQPPITNDRVSGMCNVSICLKNFIQNLKCSVSRESRF